MPNQVQKYRELRGLTQSELAREAGTTNVQISRLESTDPNKSRELTETMAIKLARALRVQPGDLMPIITDGSAPLKTSLDTHEKLTLQETLARFFHAHTDYDVKSCGRLSMAAVKYYLMALDNLKESPFFDVSAITDNEALDQNTDLKEGSENK